VAVLIAAMVQGGVLPAVYVQDAVKWARWLLRRSEQKCFAAGILVLGSLAIRDDAYLVEFENGLWEEWIARIRAGVFSGSDLSALSIALLRKIQARGADVGEIVGLLVDERPPEADDALRVPLSLPLTRSEPVCDVLLSTSEPHLTAHVKRVR
jgi:hypothetical protein